MSKACEELLLTNEMFNDDLQYHLLMDFLKCNMKENLNNWTSKLLLFASVYRDSHIRPDNYYEQWLPHYINTDFFKLFRMSREVFYELLNLICTKNMAKTYHGGNIPISVEKSLLITLWYLGKGETLISISDKFNVSQSAALHIIEKYGEVLAGLVTDYIKWPTKTECAVIEEQFADLAGYPGVIGVVDGCHIFCKVPQEQQNSYCNRKQTHSIILQGICTSNYIFTNIFVGYPGSVHDARVFQNCELYQKIQQNHLEVLYDDRYHLLGDSAYALREWLITPYVDNGRLTRAEKTHNQYHSRTRVVIENTYARLKGRWRILKYVNVNSIKKVVLITTACCVLHNFCYLAGDVFDATLETDGDDLNDNGEVIQRNDNTQGSIKRNRIKEMIA